MKIFLLTYYLFFFVFSDFPLCKKTMALLGRDNSEDLVCTIPWSYFPLFTTVVKESYFPLFTTFIKESYFPLITTFMKESYFPLLTTFMKESYFPLCISCQDEYKLQLKKILSFEPILHISFASVFKAIEYVIDINWNENFYIDHKTQFLFAK